MPVYANPFAAAGQWYRGNLHCHTTNSDGAMPPDRLVQHYAYAGWDFLAITDHFIFYDAAGRVLQEGRADLPDDAINTDITLLRAVEINSAPDSTEMGTNYHILGINVTDTIPRNLTLRGPASAQWCIDAIREQGGEAIMAHAYWSCLTLRDFEGVHGYLGLEVYNADTELHIGRGNSQAIWDDLLSHGLPAFGIAVDDCHRPGYDSLRAWTVVRAPDRSRESILAALRAGRFYASTGPEIFDVQWEPAEEQGGLPAGGVVRVRCSPARSVTLVANGPRGSRLNAGPFGSAMRAKRLRTETNRPEGVISGELLTGAEFHLAGTERYARIQVEDDRGRCAWTNPLFLRTADEASR